jgi:hypothetical protein
LKKEKVEAIWWYDARAYSHDKGRVKDLSRVPLVRTIGIVYEYPDGDKIIVNIENEQIENKEALRDDVSQIEGEGTTIMKDWIHKRKTIGYL